MNSKAILPVASLILLLLLCPAALAQSATATLSGTVADEKGAVVADVGVTVTNSSTGIARQARTGDDGGFKVLLLPPGTYSVAAQRQGFSPIEINNVVLQVGDNVALNITLKIGAVGETVDVSGGALAGLADTGGATVGKVIENRRITDLPLNGRNALALVLLTPAVKSNAGPTNSGFADRGVALTSISVNGGPTGFNSYVLDGNTNNQGFFGDINSNPAVDAIQEFKVQSSVMSHASGLFAAPLFNELLLPGRLEAGEAADAQSWFTVRLSSSAGRAAQRPFQLRPVHDQSGQRPARAAGVRRR